MIWKDIPDFPGYKASLDGRIMSLKGLQPRILKQKLDKSTNRYRVRLQVNGWAREEPVHVLIARTFHGPRPSGRHVCHNDGNSFNNHAGNLRYDTPEGNVADSIKHGTHVSCSYASATHCKQGHEYTPENTMMVPSREGTTKRLCRKCNNERIYRWRRRRKRGLTPTSAPPTKSRSEAAKITQAHRSAQMAARTHCKNGHEFTPENTGVKKSRGRTIRRCKECSRITTTRWRAKKRGLRDDQR